MLLGLGRSIVRHPVDEAAQWWMVGGCAPPIAVYDALIAANKAASQVNIINPGSFDLIKVPDATYLEPSWDAVNGWGFNPPYVAGQAGWNTGVIPSDGDFSIIIRFANQTGLLYVLAGSYGGAGRYFDVAQMNLGVGNEGACCAYGNDPLPGPIIASHIATGVMGMTPDTVYRNGVSIRSPLGVWAGVTTRAIYIGCQNNNGTANIPISGTIQRLAIWNTNVNACMPALSAAILV